MSDKPPRNQARRNWLSVLGPGLVTGAADDDPSGIATYSQVGAQFGYAMGWTLLASLPLMATIQAVCARIGATTGLGLAANLRAHYPKPVLHLAVLALLVANVINIGADLGAMGEAMALLLPGPIMAWVAGFAVLSVVLEVAISYKRYERILKWSTLSLFAYAGVVLVAHLSLEDVAQGLFLPSLTSGHDAAMALVAIFGTTISPYLFFWQASQEVEDQQDGNKPPLIENPAAAEPELRRIREDTLLGMGFSNITALFILIACAATLHAHGITNVTSAAQAAEALRPVAGRLAFALFAAGIIGTGLLAVPVLAGSLAYATAETLGWREGLARGARDARGFYAVIALATGAGAALNLIGIDPMKALYWAAVVNGLLAPPLMAVIMLIGGNRDVMGGLPVKGWLARGGWVATAVMAVIGVVFLVS